jgi:hypothetical protein
MVKVEYDGSASFISMSAAAGGPAMVVTLKQIVLAGDLVFLVWQLAWCKVMISEDE